MTFWSWLGYTEMTSFCLDTTHITFINISVQNWIKLVSLLLNLSDPWSRYKRPVSSRGPLVISQPKSRAENWENCCHIPPWNTNVISKKLVLIQERIKVLKVIQERIGRRYQWPDYENCSCIWDNFIPFEHSDGRHRASILKC